MTSNPNTLHPAFVLHRRPYRDTSLLIEAFTLNEGRLGLVARGVRGRRRSSQSALLQPFVPLLIDWRGKGELATLTQTEPSGAPLITSGIALLNGFYLNELLMRLSHRHDPHPFLFARYNETLGQLAQPNAEWSLRLFERDLLAELGYSLNFDHDTDSGEAISAEARYTYHFEQGPTARGDAAGVMQVSGRTLRALAAGDNPGDSTVLSESKRLMRWILRHYLGDKPLASRELFRQTMSKTSTPRNDGSEEQQ